MVEFNQARADDPHTWLQGFGGDTSNMAIAAARLGARSAYVTRVGNDAFGRRLHRPVDTRRRRRPTASAIDDDAPTGVYFVSHVRAATRSRICARIGGVAHDAASLPLAVHSRAARAASVGDQPGDLRVGVRRVLRGDRRGARGRRRGFPTIRTCGSSCGRSRARGRSSSKRLRITDWALPSLDDAQLLFGVRRSDAHRRRVPRARCARSSR